MPVRVFTLPIMIRLPISKTMITPRRVLQWLLLPLLLVLSNCTTVPELGGMMDQGGTSGRRIVVNLKAQKAYLYHRGKLVAVSPISSGREGKSTPVGKFSVIQKNADHRSSLYGNYVSHGKVVKENVDVRKGGRPAGSRFQGVPMPYFMRFTGAYGLHAGKVPGYPASSGCVRLPPRHAKRFFDAVKVGTPVIVQR
jgi:lipoprotein-anchoring transpeptidase ErfK/SrfK